MHYRELVTYLTFLSSIHLPSLLSEVPVREALWAVHLTLVPLTSGLWGKSLQGDNRDELVMFHASLQVVFRGPVPPIGNATYRGSRVQAFGYKGQAPKSVLVVFPSLTLSIFRLLVRTSETCSFRDYISDGRHSCQKHDVF